MHGTWRTTTAQKINQTSQRFHTISQTTVKLGEKLIIYGLKTHSTDLGKVEASLSKIAKAKQRWIETRAHS